MRDTSENVMEINHLEGQGVYEKIIIKMGLKRRQGEGELQRMY
jgi:hypothetical protein